MSNSFVQCKKPQTRENDQLKQNNDIRDSIWGGQSNLEQLQIPRKVPVKELGVSAPRFHDGRVKGVAPPVGGGHGRQGSRVGRVAAADLVPGELAAVWK